MQDAIRFSFFPTPAEVGIPSAVLYLTPFIHEARDQIDWDLRNYRALCGRLRDLALRTEPADILPTNLCPYSFFVRDHHATVV